MDFIGGGSDIIGALNTIRSNILNSPANRPGIDDIVIVMISGRSVYLLLFSIYLYVIAHISYETKDIIQGAMLSDGTY